MVHRAEWASKYSANFAVSLIFLFLLMSFCPVGLRQFINCSLSLSLSLRWSTLVFLTAINFVRVCCCCCSCYSIYTGMMSYSRNRNLGRLNFIQLNLWELSMSCAGNKSLVLSCNDYEFHSAIVWCTLQVKLFRYGKWLHSETSAGTN